MSHKDDDDMTPPFDTSSVSCEVTPVELARIRLVGKAHELWDSGRYKEEDNSHLNLLRENGWAWAIGKDEDSCGHTIAVAGKGLLTEHVCYYMLPSTSRLAGKVATAKWGTPPELIPRPEVRPGDIVVVGQGKPWGSHITLCVGLGEHGLIYTIEGNSRGLRGDGTTGRGVVRKTRNISTAQRIYRLGETHFLPEALK